MPSRDAAASTALPLSSFAQPSARHQTLCLLNYSRDRNETYVFPLMTPAHAAALSAASAHGKPDRHVEDVGLERRAYRNATGPLPISLETQRRRQA
jgi:hypothetical protein